MVDRYHVWMVHKSKSPSTKVPSFLSYSMSHSFFSFLFHVRNIDVLLAARFFDCATYGSLISCVYSPCSFYSSFIGIAPKSFLWASCPSFYSKNKLLLFCPLNEPWLWFINDAWLSFVVLFSFGELFFSDSKSSKILFLK